MTNTHALKVHGKGCCQKPLQTPTILISGKYLNSYGFGIDSQINVVCEPNKITITKERNERDENN